MRFDHAAFEATAKAILKLNEHYHGSTVDEIVNAMKSMAMQDLHDHNGYCGTGGWYVVTYDHPSGERGCTAMVEGWMIK